MQCRRALKTCLLYTSKLLESQGVEVITYTNAAGDFIVDTTEDGYKAGLMFKAEDIDLLFQFNCAYVASGRYVQGIKAAGCPVVIEMCIRDRGYGILLISSEMPEVLGMADRIIVMKSGRITAEFKSEEANQEKILEAAMLGE